MDGTAVSATVGPNAAVLCALFLTTYQAAIRLDGEQTVQSKVMLNLYALLADVERDLLGTVVT